jgi:hypothetical protein
LKSTQFGSNSNLRYSHAWLWCKYVNYGEGGLGGLCYMALGSFWLAFGLLAVLFVIDEMPFWLEGSRCQGTIINKPKHFERGSKGGMRTTYVVFYEFRDSSGDLQQGRGATNAAAWSAAREGNTIAIEYLASDPQRNRPLRKPALSDLGFFLMVTLAALLGGVIIYYGAAMLISGIRALARLVRLIETGDVTAGVVDCLKPVGKHLHGPRAYDCCYRYLIPARGGAPSHVESGTLSLHSRLARRMQPGHVLLVVFNPERPEEHAVDIHKARYEDPAELLPADAKLRIHKADAIQIMPR